MPCVSPLYFYTREQETSMGEIPRHAKRTSTPPLHDSGTYSAHFIYTHTHIFWFVQNIVSNMIN